MYKAINILKIKLLKYKIKLIKFNFICCFFILNDLYLVANK